MVFSALPNMASAVSAWMQSLSFSLVTKTIVDFVETETLITVLTKGVRVPLKPQELLIKPEGQRSWRWEHIFALTTLELNIDDIIIFDSRKYRVMSKSDYSEYGYIDYQICESFDV